VAEFKRGLQPFDEPAGPLNKKRKNVLVHPHENNFAKKPRLIKVSCTKKLQKCILILIAGE
jgi:hypothetical protein